MQESNTPDNNPPEYSGLIEINNGQDRPIEVDQIRHVVSRILADAGFEQGEVSIAVVDDSTIQMLNQKYLQHDYATDVLSFVLDMDQSSGRLDGEVIVSADTASRVAGELGHDFHKELFLYVIHGTLHLVGYRDKSEECSAKMTAAETRYMAEMGISDLEVIRNTQGNSQGGSE